MDTPITFVQACDATFGAQGFALYRSLEEHVSGPWRMLWATVDREQPYRLAHQLQPHASPRLRVVPLGELELSTPGLARVLAPRVGVGSTWWWTLGAQATALASAWYPDDVICYLDSDTMAWSDLRPVLAEIATAGADVGVVTHRFARTRPHAWARGRICSGTLTTFMPTLLGRAAAAWWAAMVRGRCVLTDPGEPHLELAPGGAGDQTWLDVIGRLARVHEIAHQGIEAPYSWDDAPVATRVPTALVNMHEWRFTERGELVRQTAYPIPPDVMAGLVRPYEAAVARAGAALWGPA